MSSSSNTTTNLTTTTTTTAPTTTSNSLRPFDISGLGMGFGVYRPRRPSYTFATQENRSRNESYRCATRKEHLDSNASDPPTSTDDYYNTIGEDVTGSHRRKTSYIKATKNPSSSKIPAPSEKNGDEKKQQQQQQQTKKNKKKKKSKSPSTLDPSPHFTSTTTTTTNPEITETKPDGNSRLLNVSRLEMDSDNGTNNLEHHDDLELGPELNLRCNSNRNSLSRQYRNSKFDSIKMDGSTEDISMTEVTLIQTLPLRGDHSDTNGDLYNEHPATNPQNKVTKNHKNTKSTTLTSSGGMRKSVSSTLRFNKNLIVLSICFILIYSSFQAIQNLQSSINASNNLGPITMMIVHIATMFSCLFAPTIINILSAKWALCLGVLFFLAWFGANFHPTFYTLVPTSLLIGLGQGIVWSAESSYIHKLAFDWSKISRASVDDEIFRFHGIFLACFQTTHIWGNLISSLWLSQREKDIKEEMADSNPFGMYMPQPALYDTDSGAATANFSMDVGGASMGDYSMQEGAPMPEGEAYLDLSKCGALFQCEGPSPRPYPLLPVEDPFAGVLWKLMIFYVLFGVIALMLVIFLLDRIGARAIPGKSPKEIILQHTSQLVTHPTLRLLIPLLLFNGLQQGFMYLDYNHYFVTCSLGVHYVGYCMITLGVANVSGAVFVTLFAHRIPREVILGFGGILHIALMIGYLIWIPEDKPVLFCILAGAWGLCDAIWQTQCNTLICLTCAEEPAVAFTNYRLVQSIGLAMVFGMSGWACVSVKLYILITLLVLAIMFYVLAEYQLRHHDDDDVFEP